MSDLIERNDLVELLKDALEEGYVDSYTSYIRKEIFDEVFEIVEDKEMMQTVDAIPIEWINKWMARQDSWTRDGVITLIRDWNEEKKNE